METGDIVGPSVDPGALSLRCIGLLFVLDPFQLLLLFLDGTLIGYDV